MRSFDLPQSMRALGEWYFLGHHLTISGLTCEHEEYAEAWKFSTFEKPLPELRGHVVLVCHPRKKERKKGWHVFDSMASGVCGTDFHIHDGEFGDQFPLVPGHETAGVVAAFGNTIQDFTGGDRVVADNSELCSHCHYCRRRKGLFYENFIAHGVVFKNLTDVEATLIEPASCAAHGLDKLALRMRSKILLFGAGPTRLMLAQLLR
ncbi:hypothetical protein N7467_004300 [Penicillium canescens]|nr:hypothetical protein N7467_004300 [Penicillium canescens]